MHSANHWAMCDSEDGGALQLDCRISGMHEDGAGSKFNQPPQIRRKIDLVSPAEVKQQHACIILGHAFWKIIGKTRL